MLNTSSLIQNTLSTGLDRTRVDHTLLVLQTLRDGVLRHNGLTGARVRRHQHALVPLDGVHGDLLERIERELVFARGRCGGHVVRDGDVWVSCGDRDLVANLKKFRFECIE